MNHPSRKLWAFSLTMLAILGLLTGVLTPFHSLSLVQAAQQGSGTNPPYISGPYTDEPNYPTVYNGDLRDLLIQPSEGGEVPAPRPVKQPSLEEQIRSHTWLDPIAQQTPATGQMLDPISSFDGLNISDAGGWHPPDTNGDVGPNHYIQTVNIAMLILSDL